MTLEALNKTQPIDSVDWETVEVKGAIVPPNIFIFAHM
jgi:hypothetical protein